MVILGNIPVADLWSHTLFFMLDIIFICEGTVKGEIFFMDYKLADTTGVSINFYNSIKNPHSKFIMHISGLSLNISRDLYRRVEL